METEDEKRTRIKNEAEAKRISEMIDRQIEQDRQDRKSQGVKILLLGSFLYQDWDMYAFLTPAPTTSPSGQAESGKSTVLKNFQLYFAPKAFENEVRAPLHPAFASERAIFVQAEVWRPVVHLNLVRSVNFIITFVNAPKTRESSRNHDASSSRRPSNASTISAELRKLCVRLAPLRQVEEDLIAMLSGRPAPSRRSRNKQYDELGEDWSVSKPNVLQEIAFPSGGRWKQTFSLSLSRRSEESSSGSSTRSADSSKDGQTRRILAALGEDITALWKDPTVQTFLQKAEIALEEQPGL